VCAEFLTIKDSYKVHSQYSSFHLDNYVSFLHCSSSSATTNAKELMRSAMAESVSSPSITDITGAKAGGVSIFCVSLSLFLCVCVCGGGGF